MRYIKIGFLVFMLMVLVGSASANVYASDSGRVDRNIFGTGDTVYVTGDGLTPGHVYCVYVVDDVISWGTADGTLLVERSNDADGDTNLYENVTADGNGDFIVAVWTPALMPGDYDVVADFGCDGYYNISRDAVSTDSIFVAGFTVVPESAIAVTLASLGIPGLIFLVRRRLS